MKKKKNETNTLPLEEVFAPSVHADLDNGTIYDTVSGLAIGFIKPQNDKIEITINPPQLLDDERKPIPKNLWSYFGENVIQNLSNQLYLRVINGYVHIGEMASSGIYASLVLPRVYQYDEQDEDAPEEMPNDY